MHTFGFIKTGALQQHKNISDLQVGDRLYYCKTEFFKTYHTNYHDKIIQYITITNVVRKENSDCVSIYGTVFNLSDNTLEIPKAVLALKHIDHSDLPYSSARCLFIDYVISTYPEGIKEYINKYTTK